MKPILRSGQQRQAVVVACLCLTVIGSSPKQGPHLRAKEPKARASTLQGHTSDIYSLAFSPDGKTLATGLFFVVAAWEDDFTGYVIDYGSYPDQKHAYFTLRDARHTLATVAPSAGLEGAIYAGLETLTRDYLAREWRRDDGTFLASSAA